ncbi:MAG: hypothetical protein IJ458_04640 [Clostridia bacterium]|nr:hypothetical protein [Clostridia bacterium]
MKVTINNEQTNNKVLEFEESFWTGKRTIVYDGVILTKIKRSVYEYKKDDVVEKFTIKGNQLIGITINAFGQTIEVARKLTWYEIVLSLSILVACLTFGIINKSVIAGAFVGGIGGGLAFTNAMIVRQIDKWYLKVIISIEILVTALLLSYIVAGMIFKAIF